MSRPGKVRFMMLLAVLMGVMAGVEAGKAVTAQPEPSGSVIQNLVERIKGKRNADGSPVDGDQVLMTVCKTPLKDISDKDIDSLIALVSDGDYNDAGDGATALLGIGPKAKRAIPALEEALKRAKSHEAEVLATIGGSTGRPASGMIEGTLEVIKGDKEFDCRKLLHSLGSLSTNSH